MNRENGASKQAPRDGPRLARGSPSLEHVLVGVYIKCPALLHLLGRRVGDHQHHLLQHALRQPLCGAERESVSMEGTTGEEGCGDVGLRGRAF